MSRDSFTPVPEFTAKTALDRSAVARIGDPDRCAALAFAQRGDLLDHQISSVAVVVVVAMMAVSPMATVPVGWG